MTIKPLAPLPFDPPPANCALIAAPSLRRIYNLLGELLRSDAAKTCPLAQLDALQTAHKCMREAIYFDGDATQELQPVAAETPLPDRLIVDWAQVGQRVELVQAPDHLPGDPFPLLAGDLGTILRHPLTNHLGVAFDGRGGGVTTCFKSGGRTINAIDAVQPALERTQS